VLDTAAHDFNGHSHAYSAEVLKAAEEDGLSAVMLGSTDLREWGATSAVDVRPIFSRDCYGRWSARQPIGNRVLLAFGRRLDRLIVRLRPPGLRWRTWRAARAVERWFVRLRFAVELWRALRRIGAGPHDTLLMHTLDEQQVAGWSLALCFIPARHLPSTALLFRHNLAGGEPVEGSGRPPGAVRLVRDLGRIKKTGGGRIHFVSDSKRLAQQHERLTGFPYLAVANVVPRFDVTRPAPRGDGIFHFVYLGNVRAEKGFAVLIRAIREFSPLGQARVAFTLQVTPGVLGADEYFKAALAAGEDLRARGVRLVTRMLSVQEYDDLLRLADAVLIPYDPKEYYARTSQIFSEAMAAGKLAVVPADTWMEDQLREIHGGGLAFSPYEPGALAAALAELSASPARYAAEPGAAARWCAENSATALVRSLRRLNHAEA